MWCESSTPKYKELSEKMDVHSPGNLRVIGAVSNTRDFARVFNCPKGKAMNPENKCDIWNAPEPAVEAKITEAPHKLNKHHKWMMHF